MTPAVRNTGYGLGGAAVLGGAVLTTLTGAGIPLIVLGGAVIASLALEGRYGRPGAPTTVPEDAWRRTNERFLDDETGQVLEVWIDPLTGERRYEPAGRDPRLPGP